MKKNPIVILLCAASLAGHSQSMEISYLTGVSTSLFGQNMEANKYPLRIKNSFSPFPNYVGEASLSVNFHKEKFKATVAYNQLNYTYAFYTHFDKATAITFPYANHIYNHAVSVGFGPNITVTQKIFFHPYFSAYISFKNTNLSFSAAGNVAVSNDNGSVSTNYLLLLDNVNFKPNVLLGVGYKFNFFVNKWLFFTVGSRYTRGFRKDFVATLSIDADGQHYETQKFMRSSNFSIDLGLGAKFNLKKKKQ